MKYIASSETNKQNLYILSYFIDFVACSTNVYI